MVPILITILDLHPTDAQCFNAESKETSIRESVSGKKKEQALNGEIKKKKCQFKSQSAMHSG